MTSAKRKNGRIGREVNSRSDIELVRTIENKIGRRMSRKSGSITTLRAFALLGIIGWSVAVPVIVGAYVGRWLDHTHGTRLTLSFIIMGFVFGCYDAYYWLSKEKRNLEEKGG